MFSSKPITKASIHNRLDIVHSIYRTRGDLKMFRHIGLRDLISSVILPFPPSSAKSYRDFFDWFISDVERCAKYNIQMYPVLGIPPAGKIDPKVLDETLGYLEQRIREHKIIGIGEIGMGHGIKEEYTTFKRQLALAGKYNLPVIIAAPTQDKVAHTSIILKELKKSKVKRAIIDHCDEDVLKLILRDHNVNIKAAITVSKKRISPKKALQIYRSYSYDERICLDSGLGLVETSLFELSKTIELFEEHLAADVLNKLCFQNYTDVFPSISQELRKKW